MAVTIRLADVADPQTRRWLLLAHQLPTRPSNARVKTWRRLQEIGAIPARNSVYVLPDTAPCRDDFDWLRREIVALGGDATVFAAEPVRGAESARLIEAFRRARTDDYQDLTRNVRKLISSARSRRRRAAARGALRRAGRNLRERFGQIERIDFFQAAGRNEAAAALTSLEALTEQSGRASPAPVSPVLSKDDFQRRRWVTRPRPGVDRMASAWLIRRAIDRHPTFAFVERPSGADIPFDMPEGEFTHDGQMCTYETIVHRFGLTDQAVVRIGMIVHDLDLKDARYRLPETSAVGHLVDGLRQLHADDHALLQYGMAVFEAFARSFAPAALRS